MPGDKNNECRMTTNLINSIRAEMPCKKINTHSDFFQKSVKFYICYKKREEIKEKLKTGYLEMSDLNEEMADEGLLNLCKSISFYEDSLAECE
ncbi:MAG: CopG family ribbon-helix-helix protein [Bacillota bacterium]